MIFSCSPRLPFGPFTALSRNGTRDHFEARLLSRIRVSDILSDGGTGCLYAASALPRNLFHLKHPESLGSDLEIWVFCGGRFECCSGLRIPVAKNRQVLSKPVLAVFDCPDRRGNGGLADGAYGHGATPSQLVRPL